MSILSTMRSTLKSHPQGIVPIFFIQIVSTLGFSILFSTLVLYAKDALGMPPSDANQIVGVFLAFNYALHLLGGYWGGRIFSNRMLFCIGMFTQLIGCLFLSVGTLEFFNIGLALFLTGAGINVTCLNCILTQRFTQEDTRRETAFLWNYSGMNLGFFIGFTLSGYFQLSQNYSALFLMGALGNIIAITLCRVFWKQLADTTTVYAEMDKATQRKASLKGLVFVILLPIALYKLLQYAALANKLVLITGVGIFLYCFYMAKQQETVEARNKMMALIAFMMAGVVFWTLYQIGPMGMTVFIQENVERAYPGGIIPPQWFSNINTLSIIAGGPLLAFMLTKLRKSGVQVSLAIQFSSALLLIGLGFALLPVGIASASAEGLVNPGWIVLYYLLQSIGELLISPIGYAMIGALAPVRLQGVMLGSLMLCTGVGASLSSYSSNLMVVGQETTLPLLTNPGYSRVFLALGGLSICCAVILIMFAPKLTALVKGKTIEPNQFDETPEET